MTVYLIGNSKGGAGKTTSAGCVGPLLASFGRRVCLFDTDVQRHLSEFWALRRAYSRLAPLRLEQGVGLVAHRVRELAREVDDVVIDAGGRASEELYSAAGAADVLLLPSKTGQSDLWAIGDMQKVIATARRTNPRLRVLAFLNDVSTNWTRRARLEAIRSALGQVDGVQVADTTLAHREGSFEKVTEAGLAVFEMGRAGDQAAQELWNLWAEVETLGRGA